MKKKTRKIGFSLKPEDTQLFRYLHEVKVATVLQINRDIYHYNKIDSLYRRLMVLQRLGYIDSIYHHDYLKMKILCLTEKGFHEFVADGTERLIELKSQAVPHDLTLVDIRYRLLKSNQAMRFYTENELKTWNDHWLSETLSSYIDVRCDGALSVKLKEREVTFSVEYEAARKTAFRVDEIIAKYYQTCRIPAVFFICEDESIHKLFVTQEIKYLNKQGITDNKFFYAVYHKLSSDRTLTFTNVSGGKLRLGSAT